MNTEEIRRIVKRIKRAINYDIRSHLRIVNLGDGDPELRARIQIDRTFAIAECAVWMKAVWGYLSDEQKVEIARLKLNGSKKMGDSKEKQDEFKKIIDKYHKPVRRII